jgi:hypothetical protein
MNLKLVTGTPFTITCVGCGHKAVAGDNSENWRDRIPGPVYADLDGDPYKAYYCNECAVVIVNAESQRAS